MDSTLTGKCSGILSTISLTLVLLLSCMNGIWSLRGQPDNGERPTYNKNDLLVAFSTHLQNVALIEASRPWRRGVRTHILVDPTLDVNTLRLLGTPHRETYAVTADFPGHPRTLRQTFVPLFALDAFTGRGRGNTASSAGFKWLLLGDDDTIFVVPALLDMLNRLALDAEQPILLSDFLVHCNCTGGGQGPCVCGGPALADPRCEPCPPGAPACPCPLPRGCAVPARKASKKQCPARQEVSFYGGVGAVFSVGLLRLLANNSHIEYFSHALANLVHGRPCSDIYLSEAVRRVGYGISSPSTSASTSPDDHSSAFAAPPPGAAPPPAPYGLGPEGPPPNLFGTFCAHSDTRPAQQLAADLALARRRRPAAFRAMVSLHVRTRFDRERSGLTPDYLAAYREIVALVTDRRDDPRDR